MDGLGVFDPAHLDDPYPLYATLRERDPVHRVPGTDFHLVSSWELVTEALARPEDFSSNLTGVMVQRADGPPVAFDMDGGGRAVHVLATADDPSHATHRKLVLAQLTKRIRTLDPRCGPSSTNSGMPGCAPTTPSSGRARWPTHCPSPSSRA